MASPLTASEEAELAQLQSERAAAFANFSANRPKTPTGGLTADEEQELADLEFQRNTAMQSTAPAGVGSASAAATAQQAVPPDSALPMPLRGWGRSDPSKPVPYLRDPYNPWQPMVHTAMGSDPNQVANLGIRAAGPAVGQSVGMLGGPFAEFTVPVGGAIGGMISEAVAENREGGGLHPGAIIGAGLTGAIPGGSLAKATGKQLLKEGVKVGAANVAAKAIQTGVDEGRLPTAAETALAGLGGAVAPIVGKAMDSGRRAETIAATQSRNSVRDATLAAGQQAGFVVPPSQVNPSFVTSVIDSIAGKPLTAQEAALRNQEVTNALARKAVGLPASAPITEAALDSVRENAAKPYEEISALSNTAKAQLADVMQQTEGATAHQTAANRATPAIAARIKELSTLADADVTALREARFQANQNYKFYAYQPNPDVLAKAQAADAQAALLESKIEDAARVAKRPELADQLRSARTTIAKTYDVERALNLGNGDVSAASLGNALHRGKPLSGDLQTIARMQQAFPPVMRPGASADSPRLSLGRAAGALGAATLAHYLNGPAAVVAATAPLAPFLARKATLSPLGQFLLASPRYGYPLQDFSAQLARFGVQNSARQKPDALPYYLTPNSAAPAGAP